LFFKYHVNSPGQVIDMAHEDCNSRLITKE
jgi:hypothetical protein